MVDPGALGDGGEIAAFALRGRDEHLQLPRGDEAERAFLKYAVSDLLGAVHAERRQSTQRWSR